MKKRLILSVILLTLIVSGIQAQDYWTQKSDFPGGKRSGAAGFSIGNKGYVGMGFDGVSSTAKSDFWEYDPTTNIWTQKADFGGGGHAYGAGFSIENKGYYGTGIYASYNWRKDFWEYDPQTNIWTQKSDFAGGFRYTMVGFSIGTKGYLGTGNYRASPGVLATYYNDFWEYDPSHDTWTRKADVPQQGRTGATGISIGSKGYIGLGTYYYDTRLKDWWEYNPLSNSWVRKADFPAVQRYDANGFSIGNRGYIGGGGYYSPSHDFYEYNPENNIWTTRMSIPTNAGSYKSVSFGIGSNGYYGLGDTNVTWNTFYQYTPYTISLVCQESISIYTDEISCYGIATGIDPIVTVNPSVITPTINYTLTYNGEVYASGTGAISGMSFQTGITTATFTVKEDPSIICQVVIKVVDNYNPLVSCPEELIFCYDPTENYNIPILNATDNCSTESISYSISGATNRTGLSNDASGTFGIGQSKVEWTVKDKNGNFAYCSTNVLIDGPINLSIPDKYAVNPGGELNTIYIGYGPASLTYDAKVTGGTPFEDGLYRYLWSTGETTSAITVTPTIPGLYNYTVTTTDKLGCTATSSIAVTVIDVRCGKNLDKVELCKTPPGNPDKTTVVCINAADVINQLKNGSHLSGCSPFTTYDLSGDGYVTIFPNPNKGAFAIQLMNSGVTWCEIRILDRDGKSIDSKTLNTLTDQQAIPFDLSGQPAGMYYLKIVTGDGARMYKILKD